MATDENADVRDLAAHQAAPLDELVEWWEDLHDRAIGSQLLTLRVPSGWGRSTVLDALADRIGADVSRPGTVVRLSGRDAPDGLALQVAWLGRVVEDQARLPGVRRTLGLGRAEGVTEAGLDLLGLFGLVTGLPAMMAGLPASLLLHAVESGRDRVEAGLLAEVARLGHRIVASSRSLPVALLIDDAELLDGRLVERLVFTILDRLHSDVLVVVAAEPSSPVLARFSPSERYGPRWERIIAVDADPAMDEPARRRLIEAATVAWPTAAVDRLAARTRSFADVWAVLRLAAAADVPAAGGIDEQRRMIDELARHAIDPGPPTPAARVLAWAGGLMHEAQLAAGAVEDEPWLARVGHAVRFAHPSYRERAERSASVLSRAETTAIASAVRDAAVAVCADEDASVIDVVGALRPVLHLAEREVLAVDAGVAALLGRLAGELGRLGDVGDALRVAGTTLDLLDSRDPSITAVANRLAAMVLRLGTAIGDESAAGRAEQLAEAMEAGAVIGLEAKVWTAITLLDRPGTRPAGAGLVDTVLDDLATKGPALGRAGEEWRLLLAFHAGQAGYLALSEKLVAPLLEESGDKQDLAFQILAAVSGDDLADLRLQHEALLAYYEHLGDDPEPARRLPVVEALASIAYRLGHYHEALRFGQEELTARLALFPPDHRSTLSIRNNVAAMTGKTGDAPGAFALLEALLPDMVRVLGADHPGTLSTRGNVAFWTGAVGDAHGALALFEALLPDMARMLGANHPESLTTRNNLAFWTGEVGDARGALALFEALLPDMARVLGAAHPDTLSTRNNLAFWTGEVGDARGALALFEALLPDMAQMLGADHPDTLTTRNNVALWTGRVGDASGALGLFQALLPDMARVLGADHPGSLTTRNNVASWTGRVGDASGALGLFQGLLPDMIRVLGADHPDTLTTRNNAAFWTGKVGHAGRALILFEALLPDRVRVLGADHPDTLATRDAIETLRRRQ